ncbi:hypothetical protein [Bacillus salipaludis]
MAFASLIVAILSFKQK